MNQYQNNTQAQGHAGIFDESYTPAAYAPAEARVAFIRKTYANLAGAILVFAILETLLFMSGIGQSFAIMILSFGSIGWIGVLLAFMAVGAVCGGIAFQAKSLGAQYAALAAYVIGEAIIFLPLLYLALYQVYGAGADGQITTEGVHLVATAGIYTVALFAGLSTVVFTTKKDFSFLRGIIGIGFFVGIALIVVCMLGMVDLGMWISLFFIALMSCCILYQTSNILKKYPTNKPVSAALGLFASIATLFWYMITLLMSRN